MAITFGLRELAVAGIWQGDHDIYRFKWRALAQVNASATSVSLGSDDAIVLEHKHVTDAVFTESEGSVPGQGDFSPGSQLSPANITVQARRQEDIVLAGGKGTLGVAGSPTILAEVDPLYVVVHTDAARTNLLGKDQYTFDAGSGEVSISASSGVALDATIHVTYDFKRAIMILDASAGAITTGEPLYYRYEPGVEYNVRAFNNLTKANTSLFAGSTLTDAVAANQIDPDNIEVVAGYSEAGTRAFIYDGISPALETADPHSPTVVVAYPSKQVANPAPADGDDLIIRLDAAAVCEVGSAATPNTLQFGDSFTTGNLEGADKIDSHAARFDAVNVTANLGGLEPDMIRIMMGHEFLTRRSGSAGDEYVVNIRAPQTRPVFRLVGRAVDSANRGMGMVKEYNMKIQSADVEFADGAWVMRNLTAMAYRNIDADNRRVARLSEWDTDTPINLDLV